MSELKLGIIGLSSGNGNPYSWAAICNGYDPEFMKDCPFKSIPRFLAGHKFPGEGIDDAKVTHLWTQDMKISRHVAAASLIENIVDRPEDLIGPVDAVLLARDDAENHYRLSRPFIEAGLPIYIDKPLAYNRGEAEKIFALKKYDDQIFTCSPLAFADELQLSDKDREAIGPIRIVEATVVKDWDRYAAHIIEPVLNIIGDAGAVKKINVHQEGETCRVAVIWQSGMMTSFTASGQQPGAIEINVIGDKSSKRLSFTDSFGAFKKALEAFVAVARRLKPGTTQDHVLKIVQIIESARGHGE